MKLSKSLLQAVALGVAMAGVASSCTFLTEEVEEIAIGPCDISEKDTDTTIHTLDNCPACGMG